MASKGGGGARESTGTNALYFAGAYALLPGESRARLMADRSVVSYSDYRTFDLGFMGVDVDDVSPELEALLEFIWHLKDGRSSDAIHIVDRFPSVDFREPTDTGWPLLGFAIEQDSPAVVKHLIDEGSDVNLPYGNWAPLAHAIETEQDALRQTGQPRRMEIIEMLIRAGADPQGPGLPAEEAQDWPAVLEMLEGSGT